MLLSCCDELIVLSCISGTRSEEEDTVGQEMNQDLFSESKEGRKQTLKANCKGSMCTTIADTIALERETYLYFLGYSHIMSSEILD
jgi:hypothetical protein